MTVEKICNSIFKDNNYSFKRIRTGKFNESYFIKYRDQHFVLRIAPTDEIPQLFYEKKMMRREPGIHKLVLDNTNIPIAKIIQYDFTRNIVNSDWLLMERLPGLALSETLFGKDELFFQLGNYIRELHSITNDWYGYPEGTDTSPRNTNWFETFKGLWSNLLRDIGQTGFYNENNIKWLTELLDKHALSFQHISTPSLLHMDIWSQNILVDSNGNLSGIIDWDRALWGDPEIEYSVLEYCGMSTDKFWKGYGYKPVIDKHYRNRRIFYLLYEHQKYIFIRYFRGNNSFLAEKYAKESLEIANKLSESLNL